MKRTIEGPIRKIDGEMTRYCPQAIQRTIHSEIEESQFDQPFVLGKGDIIITGKIIDGADPALPVALKAAGVAGVIAPFFPRAFYRNCINLGIPPIESSDAVGKIANSEIISIDFEKGEITCKKGILSFPLFPEIISKILFSGGLIPLVKRTLGK
jgi:3-isopropylmalate/(R)-2-methylmalate dehydratase small subunit